MVITMDPAVNRIKDFYEIMDKNGDLPKNPKKEITNNIDASIYRAALDEMLKRYPKDASFKKMDREFAVNNL